MQDIEQLKKKLENISKEKLDKSFVEKLNENESMRLKKESARKKLYDENQLLQDEFQDILKGNVVTNKKLLGYIKS